MKTKTRYFNMKTNFGVETVDEIRRADWGTYKGYIAELRSMLSNYRIAGMNVYLSQRCTNNWKN